MKRTKKLLALLKANRFMLLASFGILLGIQFAFQYRVALWPKLYILIAGIVFIVFFSFFERGREDKLARTTFLIIVLFGGVNALVLPIRQELDENTHYYHALELADGNIRSQTNEKNFLMVSPDFLAVTKLPSKPEYKSSENTNIYTKEFTSLKHLPSHYDKQYLKEGGLINPVYIPSALGIKIGRMISDKLYVAYYLGRLFNLVSYAILAYFAVRLSRRYRVQLFAIATLPFALWLSAGYNYDTIYYGLVLLIVAQFVNFIGKETSINFKSGCLYALSCLGLVFCKAPMMLLIILPVFLTKDSFSRTKGRLIYLMTVIFTFLLAGIWFVQAKIIEWLKPGVVGNIQDMQNTNDSVGLFDRISYFVSHPIYTIELLMRTTFDIIATIFDSLKQPQPYIPGSTSLASINLVLLGCLFILTVVTIDVKGTKMVNTAIVGIFVVITGGIFLAISGDTRVFHLGDLVISGVQGRYHFYALALLPLLIGKTVQEKLKIDELWLIKNRHYFQANIEKIVVLVTVINTCYAMYAYL